MCRSHKQVHWSYTVCRVADFAEKQMMDVDALIDNLENQVMILEFKLGIAQENVKGNGNEWFLFNNII